MKIRTRTSYQATRVVTMVEYDLKNFIINQKDYNWIYHTYGLLTLY